MRKPLGLLPFISCISAVVEVCPFYESRDWVQVGRSVNQAAVQGFVSATTSYGTSHQRRLGENFSEIWDGEATDYLFMTGDCKRWVRIGKTELETALATQKHTDVSVKASGTNPNAHLIK